MSKETAKIKRIITAAPVLALSLCVILRVCDGGYFANPLHFWLYVCFLTVLPATSYAFTTFIPELHMKGRDFERKLAIIFSLIGYVGAFITGVFCGGATGEKILASTYVISATFTAILSVVKVKSSGHSCALSGPVALLCYSVSYWFAFGFLLLIPVFYSSLRLKRHTPLQLILGAIVPVVALIISIAIFAGF